MTHRKCEWRAWVEARGEEPGPLYFAGGSTAGARITPNGFRRLLAQLSRWAGISEVTPHQLRHAAITSALDVTNRNHREAMRYSRHRSTAMVERYDDTRLDLGGEVARKVAADKARIAAEVAAEMDARRATG